MLLACYRQVDMILTAEHLLRVLHLHKHFDIAPLSMSVKPNETEKCHIAVRFFWKSLILILSDGQCYDSKDLQRALSYYLVRK